MALPARALIINVTYDTSVTSLPNAAQVEAAFNWAAQTFQNQFTNAITVNITVYFSAGIGLGQSSTPFVGHPSATGYFSYANVTNALRAARVSAADSNAVASLPASDPTGTGNWLLPRAEVKALGLSDIAANDPTSDGSVYFDSGINYALDPTNRAVAGKYDFIGVAEHEITEVLGRSTYDLTTAFIPYDLFRFTNSAARNFDPNATNVYFSINNGVTSLKAFNKAGNNGDIQDWATSTPPDAYDAFLSSGQQGMLSTNDFIALDILGYNSPGITSARLTGSRLTNGTFQVSFTNLAATSYTVLASTNLTVALINWTVLGTAIENPVGQYKYMDTQTNKLRFYRVRSP